MSQRIEAVWAKHKGNPHMAACLLIVPERRTFCGADWAAPRPQVSADYYQPVASPMPEKFWNSAGIAQACIRCLFASWSVALEGCLRVVQTIPPQMAFPVAASGPLGAEQR